MRHSRVLWRVLLSALIVVLAGCPWPGTVSSESQEGYSGLVLDLSGKPAANVVVRGFLVSNNSGSLVSNNAASYATQAAALEARTDASGRFVLAAEAAELNIEAVLSDDVKAIQLNVPRTPKGLQLQLAYTGGLSGRVTAPGTAVSNFEGVDVYIPGTSYLAKTDAAGHYALSNVAPGTFALVATKAGLGRANLPSVQVRSRATTQVADLALSLSAPAITGVVPPNAAPGETVTLHGHHFGTSTGETLVVSFGGTIATGVQRVDDQTLTVPVPDGAATGHIVLTVAGVISNGQPFAVLRSLALDPGNLDLAVGDPQALTPVALDTAGNAVAQPSVKWSSTGSAIDLQGATVTAVALGEGTVTISSGRLSSTRHIRVVSRYPQVSTLAGGINGFADGLGSAARFASPYDLVIRPDGSLLVTDTNNHRLRAVTPEGLVSTFAGTGTAGGLDGSLAAAQFDRPECLAQDAQGNLYVTEFVSRIRRISPGGEVSLWAGNGTDGYQDGPVGTAMFNSPFGIVAADDGTVYVADTYNNCIRQIRQGVVSTLAGNGTSGFADGRGATARFFRPRGLAFDADGALIVTDSDNHAIRRVSRDGTVVTIAGGGTAGYYDGNGSEALFNKPVAVAVRGAQLYVGDMNNHVIRRVTPQGIVSTYAGSGVGSFGDGAARVAQFGLPSGLAFDAAGDLLVVDDRIRAIRP